MRYYIKSNGKTYGPVEEAKIRERVHSGFFSSSCLLSVDLKEWTTFQQCIPEPRVVVPQKAAAFASPAAVASPAAAGPVSARPSTEADHVRPGAITKVFASPAKMKKGVIIAVACALLLVCGIGAVYFLVGSLSSKQAKEEPSPADFRQVCQMYQSAVALVVVTLEDSDGKLLGKIEGIEVGSDHPIGTAFAIDKNKFATNCHVAYGIKDQKKGLLQQIALHMILNHARKKGVRISTVDDLIQYCKKNGINFDQLVKILSDKVRVRNVELRLAHSNGRSLTVTGVQIHPRYKADTSGAEEFKNGEYDVAILTTQENTDRFFKLAPREKLYSLAQGQEIAYIGFPMEGLQDNGNLDLNRPEAIFKSGTINKITDFNNVFSTPEFNKSIVHDIPAAGGASGSPIFLPDGRVVAILWGVTHTGKSQGGGRIASAVQHNMAVRIDSLEIVRTQRIHDIQEWLKQEKK